MFSDAANFPSGERAAEAAREAEAERGTEAERTDKPVRTDEVDLVSLVGLEGSLSRSALGDSMIFLVPFFDERIRVGETEARFSSSRERDFLELELELTLKVGWLDNIFFLSCLAPVKKL